MPLLHFIRSAILANRSSLSLRQRIRALHVNRRMYERRPFLVTLTKG